MDQIKVKGTINVKLIGKDGKVKSEQTVNNIITNAGRQLVIDRLQGASAAVADYVAIGTGSTAAAAGDTTLGTETARAQGTLTQPDAHTDRVTYTFAAGTGTGNIQEVGRLNASSNGTLLCRGIITAVNKTASDSLAVTYDITYAAS